jgi:hypothetical protein
MIQEIKNKRLKIYVHTKYYFSMPFLGIFCTFYHFKRKKINKDTRINLGCQVDLPLLCCASLRKKDIIEEMVISTSYKA